MSQRIAIVGCAGRFPGAESVAELWQLLLAGTEAYQLLDPAQLAQSAHHQLSQQAGYVALARPLADHDCFDARFFGYAPREAALIDPQQRVLLECAWQVFEDAAIPPGDQDGRRTSVLASVGANAYLPLHALPAVWRGEADLLECTLGNDKDYAASRVAYKLDLTGSALTVQTACSSSLVAVHLGVQQLLAFEADRALILAASISLPADLGYLPETGGIRSHDGHCRPFDAAASGTVFGSGVAGVMLKRLDDAITDGDRILAVIEGSAINNDGHQRVGFTAPGLNGQVAVISEALQVAGRQADELAYVECHGTGTHMGDPVEIEALHQALQDNADHALAAASCGIGSIKSNIGHLDVAAGLSGLIKTALSLHHGQIPATLHYQRPNPALRLAHTPFHVIHESTVWPKDRPRVAGVSSFGFGGTNAHAILSAPPDTPASGPTRSWHCLPLSAATPEALQQRATALAHWLSQHPATPLDDVAWTLQTGRKALPHRRVCVADSAASAIQQLSTLPTTPVTRVTQLRWLFPGQGAHYAGMAAPLYQQEPLFRERLERWLARLVHAGANPAIRAVLLTPSEAEADTGLVQPALFALEVSLAETLMALGLQPDELLGHSLGELSAATVAGVFQPDDAARLLVARSQWMAALPTGGMALLLATAADVERELPVHGSLALALVNGPQCCVVAGPDVALEALLASSAAQRWQARRLRTSHAFHSPMLDPMLVRYQDLLSQLHLSAPVLPLRSGTHGQLLSAEEACSADYWVRQLRHTVRFDLALAHASPDGMDLEIGPPGGLLEFARQSQPSPRPGVSLCPPRQLAGHAAERIWPWAIGLLWQHGVAINWPAWQHAWLPRQKCALPGYPFARQRHWLPAVLPIAPPEGVPVSPATLPAQPRGIASSDVPPTAAPTGLTDESRMLALWRAVLHLDAIQLTDDFFALGGNSIQALRLCQLAREQGWSLTPQQVFQLRTPAALAAVLTPPVQTSPSLPSHTFSEVDEDDLALLLNQLTEETP
ncbi:type I polyketide synthase [Leeia sp.]|uniref:type I polyketide synthase n=1 Tax=Leeia sp. TaxID=2884678 RepID=UPI0035B46605